MIKTITTQDLKEHLQRQQCHVLDVREPDGYATGHVPTAVNLPLSELVERYQELDKDMLYYVICQIGGRSEQASLFLDQEGYQVVNVLGGTSAWPGH